jgi:16S rRNA (cytosine1402-N4)-methyltransferase
MPRPKTVHIPVLLREVLQVLQLQEGLTVVDGTEGAGGHSFEILKRIGPSGTLIGLDRDDQMLEIAARKVSGPNCHLIQSSYARLGQVLDDLAISHVDRVLLDLGLSSDQLADHNRGFSFHATGELDLRFDRSQGEPAWAWLAKADEQQLADVIHQYGEDHASRRIARQLVTWRATHPLKTGQDLVNALQGVLPPARTGSGTRHPATRIFQALRIAVNQELTQLELALDGVLHDAIQPGGILAIITFHSLEDRLVKQAFRQQNLWQPLTPKPLVASNAEQRLNPRSRTAKLRAAIRI